MKLQDSLKRSLFKEPGFCVCLILQAPIRRNSKKRTLFTWLFFEAESGRVEQSKQLAKGEGAAEPLPSTGWRHLAQQPLALSPLWRMSPRKTQPLTQSLEGTALTVVAAEQCIRHAQMESEIKSCI